MNHQTPLSYTQENIHSIAFNSESEFENIEFQGIDFTKIELRSISFLECKFKNCNMANQSLINADFRSSREYALDLRTTKIKGAQFSFPEVISLITALGAKVEM